MLHDTDFVYIFDLDANREKDGLDLRRRFIYEHGYTDYAEQKLIDMGPCSVLEMMIALAQRCEEHIMSDPENGDCTGKWFFAMVDSLGLSEMDDAHFDAQRVSRVIERFMYRKYSPNGKGGLFTIPNCQTDMRRIEIWYQMMRYLTNYVYGGNRL